MGPLALPGPVTAMAFDNEQNLLWTGNDYVGSRVTKGRLGTEADARGTGSSDVLLWQRAHTIHLDKGSRFPRWSCAAAFGPQSRGYRTRRQIFAHGNQKGAASMASSVSYSVYSLF
jgi:hypothetical protein